MFINYQDLILKKIEKLNILTLVAQTMALVCTTNVSMFLLLLKHPLV